MIRRAIAVTVVALGASAVMPAAPAQARFCMPDHQCTTYYYSDSSHSTQVGSLYEECDGSRYSSGRRTGYFTFSEIPCGSPR
ncbi:DUF6289 family protein [Micromonospora sp. NPDC050980]|uniref:DUF6289 family protein n=1 Tax=Micromonospora sp. NPDC050980 TaxID=3155161 RepID=UPI0033E4CBF3